MITDTFEFLNPINTSVANKPVPTLQTVYRLTGDLEEKAFRVFDSNNIIIDEADYQLTLTDVPNERFSINYAVRQISNNQRYRIVKIFYKVRATLIMLSVSGNS